ncbi:hypothetical protein TNCV_4525201 [Trichonephila clavipes]|nr:hypothetical protein TNCV_4525201 [Trichonephila clavipes]
MLDAPYTVLLQRYESSPQDELYEVWHYLALKEKNHQWLPRKIRYGRGSQFLDFIPLNHQIVILNDMPVGTSTYVDSSTYPQSTSSVM